MTISPPVEDHKDWEREWAQSWAPDDMSWGESLPVEAAYQTACEIEWETFHWDGFKKDSSKEIYPSFQYLRRSLTSTTLFFLFIGIQVLFPFGAYAARGKDGTNPGQPVNNVNVAMIAPVHPVHPMHNVVRPAEIMEIRDIINQLALRANIRIPDLNSPPEAPNPALPPVPAIDRSPNHEEKWKGDLTQENLDRQREQGRLLRHQGNNLRYELHELDPNHNLLTRETAFTLDGYKVRRAIRAERMHFLALRRNLGSVVFDTLRYRFQLTETTVEEYRDWFACADTLYTAIQELRRPPR